MKYEYLDLKKIFISANNSFMNIDKKLFESKVSERTLCGALMLHLHEQLKQTVYSSYNIDIEYNRNKGGKQKNNVKTIRGLDSNSRKINCDLIVHRRGKKDNLIAIEMKKSTRLKRDKEKDKERLRCLTQNSFDEIYSFDGKTLPEHVCGYIIGMYYEINYAKRQIEIEYYHNGEKESSERIPFLDVKKSF